MSQLRMISRLLLASGIVLSSSAWADTVVVKSQIQKVTVYPQQGLIERYAKVNLNAGEHTLHFAKLSNFLDTNSLQFTAKGVKPLTLLGIETKPASQDLSVLPEYIEAEKPLKAAQALVSGVEDQLQLLQRQLDLLDKLESNVASSDKAFHPENFQQLQNYTSQSAANLFKERRQLQEQLTQYQQQVEKAQIVFDEQVQKLSQRSQDVWVKVQVAQSGQYDLGLSYINGSLSWQPSYQLYYHSQQQEINLRAYAQLNQHTGEDWQGVQLVFSTGMPIRANAAPETQPWIVDYYQPRVQSRIAVEQMEMQNKAISEDAVVLEAMAAPALEIETSHVDALFSLSNKTNVPSQEGSQLVLLNESSQKVSREYAYYAQYQDAVFVSIKGKNSADYPLLAGELQTFYDGRFMGKGHLNTLYPQQEFTQLVGQDQTITVKKSPLKRFAENTGVISKTQVVRSEQETVFHNRRAEAVEIVVHNRVPSSRHEDIIVKVQEPKGVNMDNLGRYTQKITVPAKQSLAVKQAFSVEYPQNKQISGL